MERFNALGRGLQIMLVAGVLLLIDSFLEWQEAGGFGVNAWDDVGGIVMGLLTIVLIVWIGVRVAGIDIPLPVSSTLIAVGLAVLIFLFALIKNLQDDFSTIWAWIGLILSIAILVGAWLQVQAAGGMNALRTEVTSMQSPRAQTSPPAPTAPPPAPAPEAPAPEAAPEPAPPMEPEPPAEPDEPRRSDL